MHKHFNAISIFIPHLGCPHTCTFCNQRAISLKTKAPTKKEIEVQIEKAVTTAKDTSNFEIAYFGGSFTCLNRDIMLYYLEIAYSLIKKFNLHGIRISTRPDGIDNEILTILKQFKVTTIELGAQSLNDKVLELSERGHTSKDTAYASGLIKDFGFDLVLQMMVGMPGDTKQGVIETAEKIISLRPNAVRIYPLLVIKDTTLERLYRSGDFTPLTLDEAIDISAELMKIFKNAV